MSKKESKEYFSQSERFLGNLLYTLFWLVGQLPAWWHYLWADLFGFMLQHMVRYRRGVVHKHLLDSFPEKTAKERKELTQAIYRHLGNLIVEYFMLAGFSKSKLKRHIQCDVAPLMDYLHQEKGYKNVFYLLGHYGNWEWFTGFQEMLPMTQLYVLYKHQSGALNYVLYKIRSKFGSELVEKEMAARKIISLRNTPQPKTFIFVADQTPAVSSIYLYVDFLKQETAVFTGMEKLARSMKVPVIYIDVEQVARGKYRVTGELMTEDASEYEEGMLAKDFMKRLEKTILRKPELWLWTHRRWKHKRENIECQYPEKVIKRL